MEKRFPLDIESIVSQLIQLCEMTLGQMTIEGCKDFPTLLCRELARCTRGQVQLVLTERNHFKDAPSLNEQGFTTPVRFGSETFGWLLLSFPSEQSEESYPTLQQRQMLAHICGCMLWMFAFARAVPLPRRKQDVPQTIALTERERVVLNLLCQWRSSQEIARQMGIEKESVEKYQRSVRAKLRVEHDLQVPLVAFLSGLFSPLTDLRDEND